MVEDTIYIWFFYGQRTLWDRWFQTSFQSYKQWQRISRYLGNQKVSPKINQYIQATGQSIEQHTKKVVQMHYLARNFAALKSQEL